METMAQIMIKMAGVDYDTQADDKAAAADDDDDDDNDDDGEKH